MLLGTLSVLLPCQPAPSTTSATWLVLCDRRGESVEEHLHARRVGVRQDQHEIVVGAGLDGGVDVGVGVALVENAPRALTALPPDVADAAFLPDACFVLEIQAQTLILMRTLNVF
jgi:hypothetical protein